MRAKTTAIVLLALLGLAGAQVPSRKELELLEASGACDNLVDFLSGEGTSDTEVTNSNTKDDVRGCFQKLVLDDFDPQSNEVTIVLREEDEPPCFATRATVGSSSSPQAYETFGTPEAANITAKLSSVTIGENTDRPTLNISLTPDDDSDACTLEYIPQSRSIAYVDTIPYVNQSYAGREAYLYEKATLSLVEVEGCSLTEQTELANNQISMMTAAFQEGNVAAYTRSLQDCVGEMRMIARFSSSMTDDSDVGYLLVAENNCALGQSDARSNPKVYFKHSSDLSVSGSSFANSTVSGGRIVELSDVADNNKVGIAIDVGSCTLKYQPTGGRDDFLLMSDTTNADSSAASSFSYALKMPLGLTILAGALALM
jgi:hypothetical protein